MCSRPSRASTWVVVDLYQSWGVRALVFLGTLFVAWVVARYVLVPPVVSIVERRNRENPTLVAAMETYLRVLVVVIAVPIAMTAAGFGSIVAGSAVVVAAATLALGVAGQDVIGNLVSGLFLVADPDFNVGDHVQWDDAAGTITEIDLRVTRIRSTADELVIVPNTVLATSAVTAPFSGGRYRVTEDLTVAYGEDTDEVAALLTGAAAADDRVLDDPAPRVNVVDLSPSGVQVSVRFWIGDPSQTDIPAVRTALLERAREHLVAADVAVAPPAQQELSGSLTATLADDGTLDEGGQTG
ncbi:MAG: mechanosensitive ion channel family protein [Halobacteriaceae archaeon]